MKNEHMYKILIDDALNKLDDYIIKHLDGQKSWSVEITQKVLEELKRSSENELTSNTRLIRAFIDVSVIANRNFENTELGEAILKISSYFYKSIPGYDNIDPLGMEFGKEIPF